MTQRTRFLRLLLFFTFALSPVLWAQTRQLEVGGHYAALSGSWQNSHGVGTQLSYDFSHRFGFDTGLTVYPADNHQLMLGQGKLLEFGAGLRFAAVRTQKVALFAFVKPGFLRLSDLRVDFPAEPAFPPLFPATPALTLREGAQTNFAFNFGGTAEFYPSHRTYIRADFSDVYVRYGDFIKSQMIPGTPPVNFSVGVPAHGQHQYRMAFGGGWRFGKAETDDIGNEISNPDRRWTAFAQYSTLGFDGWRSGAGVLASRRIGRDVEWDAMANVFPSNGNQDSIWWYGSRVIQFQTGPAIQFFGGRIVSVKGAIRPGLLNYSDYGAFGASAPMNVGSQTEFNLNYGVIAEFNHWNRFPIRIEVDDNLVRHRNIHNSYPPELGQWQHVTQVSAGVGFRF